MMVKDVKLTVKKHILDGIVQEEIQFHPQYVMKFVMMGIKSEQNNVTI